MIEKLCPECGCVNRMRMTCSQCHTSLYPIEKKPMTDEAKAKLAQHHKEKQALKQTYRVEPEEVEQPVTEDHD